MASSYCKSRLVLSKKLLTSCNSLNYYFFNPYILLVSVVMCLVNNYNVIQVNNIDIHVLVDINSKNYEWTNEAV